MLVFCYIVPELPRPRRRLTDLIVSSSRQQTSPAVNNKSWRLRFLLTPSEILTHDNKVTGVRFLKNKLTVSLVCYPTGSPTPYYDHIEIIIEIQISVFR